MKKSEVIEKEFEKLPYEDYQKLEKNEEPYYSYWKKTYELMNELKAKNIITIGQMDDFENSLFLEREVLLSFIDKSNFIKILFEKE